MANQNRNEFSRPKSENKSKQKNRGKSTRDKSQDTDSVKKYRNKSQESCEPVEGLTPGQRLLIKTINRATVTFITGPPGTGKTFISTALTADALEQGYIDNIVCTRPIVSCGSDLGILPGDVSEKFGPYMQPIMDVFNKRIGKSGVESYIKNGRIKQVPLQLLRGSSIDNATILLDEAQNCDAEQLVMLLTRIGVNTKLIINGDLRQKDIKNSGLQYVLNKVSHIKEIEHIHLDADDIVRSDIVKDIVLAFWSE